MGPSWAPAQPASVIDFFFTGGYTQGLQGEKFNFSAPVSFLSTMPERLSAARHGYALADAAKEMDKKKFLLFLLFLLAPVLGNP